ncbi:unnamed protein product [Dimorphilus gyrociliatus]|uniref:Aminotransferase class I/classII large domain-containing protein n=1 Tax=Dimorphilus gyrociliatus TaxID=2664684 RepID=A0A7I8WF01_9ANNE|nr:unnamed protein product [Dimorphilus gyrociliatus]
MLRSYRFLKVVRHLTLSLRYQSTADKIQALGPISPALLESTGLIKKALGDVYFDSLKGDIDFSSCDYLSYSAHPYLNQIDGSSIVKHGRISFNRSSCYNRHPNSKVTKLEEVISEHAGGHKTIFVNSGTEANQVAFQVILQDRPEVPIYLDKYSHPTMDLGAKAIGRYNSLYFNHCDVDHLRELIRANGPGLVGVDSVYSAFGTMAPIEKIAQLCKETGCIFLVDESHSYGIYNEDGGGLVKQLGLEDDIPIRTFSTGKAMGAGGGAVVLNKVAGEYIDDIRKGSNMSIFTLAAQDCLAERLIETVKLVKTEKWRRDDLFDKIKYFKESCIELGYNGVLIRDDNTLIPTFIVGSLDLVLEMNDDFIKEQMFPAPDLYPSATEKNAAIRFAINHTLTYPQINRALNLLKLFRNKYKPETWPDANPNAVLF